MPVAILFIVGIALHRVLPVYPLAWLIAITLLVAAAIPLVRRPVTSSVLIGVAIVLCGCAGGQLAYWYFPRDHVSAFVSEGQELGWIEGMIEDTPRVVEGAGRGRPLPDRQTFEVGVKAVLTWKGWAPASGTLPVAVSPPRTDLGAGQRVRLLGRIDHPAPAMNPGAFDSAQFYRRERALVTLRVSRPYDVQVLSQPSRWAGWLTRLREKSRELLDRGFVYSQTTDRATLRALVFGDREPAVREVEEAFSVTGTTHLLAANGTRVAMLAMFVFALAKLTPLPPRHAVLAVTVCVAAFGLTTLPMAQAIRPVIVCAAVGGGLLGRRVGDSIQLLALAAVAILVARPTDLYGAGFQLSFVIVLALIVLTRPLVKFIESLEDEDKRVARSFAPHTKRRWLRDRGRRWTIEFVAAAAIGWLAAIPLVAFHFEQFNLWTIPFSLLLSPFAILALAAGLMKLLLTALCPPLAGLWAGAALGPAWLLRHAVALLAKVPGADLPVAPPALWTSLLFYALLCAPLLAWSGRRARWCARCAPACGFAVLLLVPLWATRVVGGPGRGGMRVTLLAVGAGQCAVVEPGGGGTIVLDAGSSTLTDAYRSCVAPFLRHQGCLSVSSLWLSHGDFDHISATEQMIAGYGVGEVVASPHFRRHAPESKPCEALLAMLDRTKHSPHTVVAGDRVSAGAAQVEVLWPPADTTFNSNNAGVVLRITCAGRSILFPADIQEPAERELLKHPERLKSDVLIAPHHGSSERSTPAFVAAVQPKVILSSNDNTPSMKQRQFDSEVKGMPFFRTDQYGAMTVDISADGKINVGSFRAGTVMQINR